MLSNRRLDQQKSARTAAAQASKKRKSEASLVFNAHLEVKDDKLSTTSTSNIEGKSETWFWNKSTNESNLETKKMEDEDEKKEDKNKEEKENNQEEVESRIQKAISLGIPKIEIKWNRQRDNKLQRGYQNRLRTMFKKQSKFT